MSIQDADYELIHGTLCDCETCSYIPTTPADLTDDALESEIASHPMGCDCDMCAESAYRFSDRIAYVAEAFREWGSEA